MPLVLAVLAWTSLFPRAYHIQCALQGRSLGGVQQLDGELVASVWQEPGSKISSPARFEVALIGVQVRPLVLPVSLGLQVSSCVVLSDIASLGGVAVVLM